MIIPFTGQAYQAKYRSLNGQRCVNYYPVLDQSGGKSEISLYPTPGYTSFVTTSGTEVRGCFSWNNIGYKVVGNTLYSVTATGTKATIGTLSTTSGRCQFVANSTQILVIDGTYGYVYTISTGSFAQVTDPDFPSTPVFVDYQDGFAFLVALHADGNYRIYFSNTSDFTAWTATDVLTPTSSADQARACLFVKEQLHIFSDLSLEIYYNNNGTFERRPLSSLRYGIAAQYSAVRVDESIIYLTRDELGRGFIARYEQDQIKAISTEAITYQINTYTRIDDAFAFAMQYQGHIWYVLTFPSASATWVYDITTQSWFEWASLSSAVNASAIPGRHTANCYMNLSGKHIIGDYESGNLYEIKDTLWTSSPGTAATMMLQVSKDGGHNWSPERLRTKQIGEYQKRPLWLGLGTARKWMFRLKFADTVNTENGRTVIRTRETAHFAQEDKYVSISSLRVEVDIDPVPFCIINAYANGSISGLAQQDPNGNQ